MIADVSSSPRIRESDRAGALRRTGGWALPLAVVAVLAIGLTLVTQSEPVLAPGVPDAVRGNDLQLLAPLGSVEQIQAFTWQSPIRADRYRVVVRQGPNVVWQMETRDLSVPPPLNVFVRDVEYRWQVEALDREGSVRLTSPSLPFTVY